MISNSIHHIGDEYSKREIAEALSAAIGERKTDSERFDVDDSDAISHVDGRRDIATQEAWRTFSDSKLRERRAAGLDAA